MKPRCVVLDGFTLTHHTLGAATAEPGEPTWEPLSHHVDLTVYARTPELEMISRAQGAPLLLTNKVTLGAEEIQALPGLRYIGVLATGTNVVDIDCARERGIVVTNVPGYAAESVVAQVFGLLLELSLGVAEHAQAVAQGKWQSSPDFSFQLRPTQELFGKTLGIVGLGTIGRRVATVATAFGMRVLAAHSHRGTNAPPNAPPIAPPSAPPKEIDVEFRTLDELFAESDVITLHCPLVEGTRHLVNAQRLALMKPSALLINTGRGPLVDEVALDSALRRGTLAGAGLDVLSTEPPEATHPLIGAPRCLITPHMGWATQAARQRLMSVVTQNVEGFLAGSPQNQVGI